MYVLKSNYSGVSEYEFTEYSTAVDELINQFKEVTHDLLTEREINLLRSNDDTNINFFEETGINEGDVYTYHIIVSRTLIKAVYITSINYISNDPDKSYFGYIRSL